jgi:hypothetical protein
MTFVSPAYGGLKFVEIGKNTSNFSKNFSLKY